MLKDGLQPPEPVVRWLKPPPYGEIRCVALSGVVSERRHYNGRRVASCSGFGCSWCANGHPYKTRYFFAVRCEIGDCLIELGSPQFQDLQALDEQGWIGAVFTFGSELLNGHHQWKIKPLGILEPIEGITLDQLKDTLHRLSADDRATPRKPKSFAQDRADDLNAEADAERL